MNARFARTRWTRLGYTWPAMILHHPDAGASPLGERSLRLRRLVARMSLLMLVAGSAPGPGVDSATAAVTIRRSGDRPDWPPGTQIVPCRLLDGNVVFDATLRSKSGREVSGLLILDTGAPNLVIKRGAWNTLQVDTLERQLSSATVVRRPLASIQMGSARVEDVDIGGVLPDSVLGHDVLGLFGPSLIEDRAVALNYSTAEWALVPPRLAMTTPDASLERGTDLMKAGRIRASRAAYGALFSARAVPVPFRLFEGGRVLVTARVTEPDRSWSGQPLTLLLDTGASTCVLFEDAVEERVSRVAHWPRRRDVTVRTVLGRASADVTVLPVLRLEEASSPLRSARVEAGIVARKALPDLEGTLPERIHGLLGNTFLARHRLVLDYGNRVLWLEPMVREEEGRDAPIGLRLERRWGDLLVATVASGSAADRAGIRVGDAIVSIGGAATSALSAEQAASLLEGDARSEVVLSIRRGGMTFVHRLRRGPSR